MLNKQGLIDFFALQPDSRADEVLVFAPQSGERLRYTCNFIFYHGLGLRYRICADNTEFNTYSGPKINYSRTNFNSGLWIKPAGLLEESALSDRKPKNKVKEGKAYFFSEENVLTGAYHFDIFSAVFFLISRYEEWQSFDKDAHGRFEASQSILFDGRFHQKPVVELWLKEFGQSLKNKFQKLSLPERHFRVMSTIDVDNLYAFRAKGILRTSGAALKDVLKLDYANLKERLAVIRHKKKDPFDIYEEVSDFCFEEKIPLLYFFLFRTGTKFDRTVSPSSPAFDKVFETVHRHHATMGIHPSYDASVNPEILKREIKAISEKSNKTISFSRQHFLRFNIRSTPKELLANGISVDFTMGFASEQGLRAGTTLPFYYYDFEKERVTDLLFIPFCTMDGVYTIYKTIPAEVALEHMIGFAQEIKQVGGNFVSVFHERSFSDHLYPGFGSLYKNLHIALKER